MSERIEISLGSQEPKQAAVLMACSGPVGAHIGIWYRSDDSGARRLLHLAWHYDLCDDDKPFDHGIWVVPALDDDTLTDVRTATRLVAQRHADGPIPYGFARRDAQVDERYTLVLGESLGLSCADFVLVVIERAGVDLIDESSWDVGRSEARRAEDERAQAKLVAHLERSDEDGGDAAARAQAARVKRQVGVCTRIRAEEVAGASGVSGWPITYERAQPRGREVLDAVRIRLS